VFGDHLIFRVHAIRRMFNRGISDADVRNVIANGEGIEAYPADVPYPSRLMLGWKDGFPLHVVVAYNADDDQTIIVTVYRPDPDRWSADFRKRKKP
jgi:uncharacterized protein DUF4258